MLVEFGKANYFYKAKQQPDKVKIVIDKVKTDGLRSTYESVVNKLNQRLPLGYCNVGKIIKLGKGVSEFKIGDRVASNGAHAEFVSIPKNLVAKIPKNVTDDEAAFTVIGSIALQGIRLCNPTFGETIAVIGLGLIGLITAELLIAAGCNVIGFDFDEQKVNIAQKKGIIAICLSSGTDPIKYALEYTNEIGVDGVIITASSKSDDIIHQAAQMSRKRGRIILVGVVGLNIRRDDFFKKELTFQVSCSYGPGRYDENYEVKGQDYPIGFVRWTEKRNFETILHTISSKQLDVNPLITERVKLENYNEIYGDLHKSGSIASILLYDNKTKQDQLVKLNANSFQGQKGVIGIIGAGNFTSSTLLPRLSKTKAHLKYIADLDGLLATSLAKRFNIANATSDHQMILQDENVDTVMVITRHNVHAKLVIESLKAGKNVFVEKPLALNNNELQKILEVYNLKISNPKLPTLTVGFNRRFSPHIQAIKKSLGDKPGAINVIATMNAGFIPQSVWVHDLQTGGGRIIGEACHYLDLCVYLTGSEIRSVCMNALGEHPKVNTDNASILVKFMNGSNAVINYFANGAKSYSKERVEVYSLERTWIMDNFRTTRSFGVKGFRNLKTRMDKGHKNQFQTYINRIKSGGEPLIPINEIVNVTSATFAAIQSMQEKRWVTVLADGNSFNA